MFAKKTIPENYSRKFEIDWRKYPSVVFESDDWGACERARDQIAADKIRMLYKKYSGRNRPVITTLETGNDLEKIYRFLEKYKGIDNIPAVFTVFVCTANPDFTKIRANGYSRYEDIGLDEGVPESWERGNTAEKLREGYDRGSFYPGFHSSLHHTSPYLWMQLLRDNSDKGKLARALFDMQCYAQGEHLPEFNGMNLKIQNKWISGGVARFKNIFGFTPDIAITSDAYPDTETVWALNGINTVCLKNSRSNHGETIVYATKPWNMQDIYAKIGDYNEIRDVIYITRNAFFESGMAPGWNDSAADVLRAVTRNLDEFCEPSIVSTHRINYVSLDKKMVEKRFSELGKLLDGLCKMGVHFLTTSEVSQLYRQGWSVRKFGNKTILRKWHKNAKISKSIFHGRIIKPVNGGSLKSFDTSGLRLGSYFLVKEDISEKVEVCL